jgi:hypothetical protein
VHIPVEQFIAAPAKLPVASKVAHRSAVSILYINICPKRKRTTLGKRQVFRTSSQACNSRRYATRAANLTFVTRLARKPGQGLSVTQPMGTMLYTTSTTSQVINDDCRCAATAEYSLTILHTNDFHAF